LVAAVLISEPSEVFLITLTLVGSVFLGWKLIGPLMQALARRLEPRSVTDPAGSADIAELRARVQELEAQQARVQELEERLDFTERLLAQQRDQARLPAGGEGR
jgi:hypothetical protein